MEPCVSAENGVPVRSATLAAVLSLRALSGEWGPQGGVLRTAAPVPRTLPHQDRPAAERVGGPPAPRPCRGCQ